MGRIDQHTYEDIYRLYSGKLYGVCLHYVQDKETANDLLHDSFIIILSSLDQVKDMSKLESWMRTIVKNIALNHLRNKNRARNISLEDIPEPVCETDENLHPDISFDQILPLVDTLPERYGKVFRLSVLEGLSHDEIGHLLGIGPHSSSSNLSRAKALLRKAIMKHFGIVLMVCSLILILLPLFIGSKQEPTENVITTETSRKIDNVKSEIAIPIELPISAELFLESRMASNEPVIADTTITDVDTSVVIKQHLTDTTRADSPKNEVKGKSFKNTPYRFVKPDKRDNQGKGSIMFTVSGGGKSTSDDLTITTTYPDGDFTASPEIIEKKTEYIHAMPITLSASFRWNISRRWAVNTGLRYTYLSTKINETTTKGSLELGYANRKQQMHYLGIPLNASYSFWYSPKWNAYVSAGVVMELPCASNIDGVKMNAPFMWAAETGVGLQYDITDHIGIYVNCNMQYFFNTDSEIRNAWTDRPLGVSIPIGIRYTW